MADSGDLFADEALGDIRHDIGDDVTNGGRAEALDNAARDLVHQHVGHRRRHR